MGYTRQHRIDLQQRADGGDQQAAAQLINERARNLENKRRSDANLRASRANSSNVTKAVEHRLQKPAQSDAPKMPLPPPRPHHPPPEKRPPVMQLVEARVEGLPPRRRESQGVDPRHLRAIEGFEGVKWKPLGEIRSESEGKEELGKCTALERAVAERKEALERMVKGKGRAQ